jgi:hypothetical protein
MIPWRAIGPARHGIEGFFSLTPVTFYPDVASFMVIPVSGDPTGVGVGWFDVRSGDPDVTVAVPAVIAFVPGPVGVLVGRGRHNLVGTFRWTDANYDLGLCDACNQESCAG